MCLVAESLHQQGCAKAGRLLTRQREVPGPPKGKGQFVRFQGWFPSNTLPLHSIEGVGTIKRMAWYNCRWGFKIQSNQGKFLQGKKAARGCPYLPKQASERRELKVNFV